MWNPVAAPWIAELVTGESTYWRIFWLLPLPALFGVVLSAPRSLTSPGGAFAIPGGAFAESRRNFLSGDTGQMLATTWGGGLRDVRGQFKTLFRGEQLATLRNFPMQERGLARSILAGLQLLLVTPIQLLLFPPVASIRAMIHRRRQREMNRSA